MNSEQEILCTVGSGAASAALLRQWTDLDVLKKWKFCKKDWKEVHRDKKNTKSRKALAQKTLRDFSLKKGSEKWHYQRNFSNCGKEKAPHANCVARLSSGRGSRTWTHDQRFWRPRLYQLSYTPICSCCISGAEMYYIIMWSGNQEFFSVSCFFFIKQCLPKTAESEWHL